ncbi:MAG: hypothetical protein HYU73_12085 [Betaproteobacteria bacterium]|nr:hypothetical protein [Betaproteobacteria bacterium]
MIQTARGRARHAVSCFAHDFANEIAEVDINPLIIMARGAGARVVDALIVRRAAVSTTQTMT